MLDRSLWFFDYDGSLCPHLEIWEKRSYEPKEIVKLLNRLTKTGAQVYWNTGRRVESLESLDKEYLNHSGYFVQGSFFWDATKHEAVRLAPELPATFVIELQNEFKKYPLYRLEIKPTSMRIAPLEGVSMDAMPQLLKKMVTNTPQNWKWLIGHRGAELLPEGFDKGSGLLSTLKLSAKKSIPIAIGDDLFDKPAVEAALQNNGYAILVGEGCGWITEVAHSSEQIIFFENPEALHRWILELLK